MARVCSSEIFDNMSTACFSVLRTAPMLSSRASAMVTCCLLIHSFISSARSDAALTCAMLDSTFSENALLSSSAFFIAASAKATHLRVSCDARSALRAVALSVDDSISRILYLMTSFTVASAFSPTRSTTLAPHSLSCAASVSLCSCTKCACRSDVDAISSPKSETRRTSFWICANTSRPFASMLAMNSSVSFSMFSDFFTTSLNSVYVLRMSSVRSRTRLTSSLQSSLKRSTFSLSCRTSASASLTKAASCVARCVLALIISISLTTDGMSAAANDSAV